MQPYLFGLGDVCGFETFRDSVNQRQTKKGFIEGKKADGDGMSI